MKPYRHLLFDIDNTLLDFTRAEHDAMLDALRSFGYPADERIISVYSRINDEHWKLLERGLIDRATLLWRRFEVLGEVEGLQGLDPHAFSDAYITALSGKSYLMDGALDICARLAEKYPLYGITNGNARVQHGRFDPSPLRPYFRHSFISEEIGAAKPSQAFFDIVCRAVPEIDPAHTLVIGDSLTSDIAGGICWGTDTCWVSHGKTLNACSLSSCTPTYTVAHLSKLANILL